MDNPLQRLDEQTVQRKLWSFAVRSTEHAVLLLDANGNVSWANEGAHAILGAAPDGLVGGNMSRFFTRRDVTKGIPEHELDESRHRGSASDDRWMCRADRSRFWASGVTVYLGGEASEGVHLKLFRDLTEFKMQMENSRERCRAASQENENLTMGIGLLAHELRNPLSGITLASDLLEQRHGDDARLAPTLKVISTNTALAGRLVEDLMQHSKLSSDRFSLDRSGCTARELLKMSTSIALRQMEQEGRAITVLVPAGDIELCIDRMRMQQVFVNLIANALRYTPAPGRIWVTATLEGKEAIVRVSDEGIGIEPKRLKKLFDLFTLPRLGGSKLGLGIGLTLVKKIVELHGGSVQARSDGLNKGSQFIVRFPVRE